MKSFDSRKWLGFVIGSTAVILMICGVCVFILDPFFHYREPANNLIYGTIVRNDSGENRGNDTIDTIRKILSIPRNILSR